MTEDDLSPVDRLLIRETSVAAGHRDTRAVMAIMELLAKDAEARSLTPMNALAAAAGFFLLLEHDYTYDVAAADVDSPDGYAPARAILDEVARATVEDAKRTGEAIGRDLPVERLGRAWVAHLVGGVATVMGQTLMEVASGQRTERAEDGATLLRSIGRGLGESLAAARAGVGQA